MDIKKQEDVLQKCSEIEKETNSLKQINESLNVELIKLETIQQQTLEELKQYNITPEQLEQTIEEVTKEVEDDIARYNSAN